MVSTNVLLSCKHKIIFSNAFDTFFEINQTIRWAWRVIFWDWNDWIKFAESLETLQFINLCNTDQYSSKKLWELSSFSKLIHESKQDFVQQNTFIICHLNYDYLRGVHIYRDSFTKHHVQINPNLGGGRLIFQLPPSPPHSPPFPPLLV